MVKELAPQTTRVSNNLKAHVSPLLLPFYFLFSSDDVTSTLSEAIEHQQGAVIVGGE